MVRSFIQVLALCLPLIVSPVASAAAPRVELALVEAAEQQPLLSLTGELQAQRRSVLSAEVAGPADQVDELRALREADHVQRLLAVVHQHAEPVADLDAARLRELVRDDHLARAVPHEPAPRDEVQVVEDLAAALQLCRLLQSP